MATTSGGLAAALDGSPVVANATARDLRFPLASRVTNQRVFRVDTLVTERWDGAVWQVISTPSLDNLSVAGDADILATSLTLLFTSSVAKALRINRLAGWIARLFSVYIPTDPKFGALADGVTDDTAAIQAAITAAAGGGRVWLIAATHLVTDTLTIANHGVVPEGASGRTSRIRFNPASNKPCIDFLGTSSSVTLNQCGLKHITIESTNTVQKTAVRWTDVSQFFLEDVNVDISFVGNGTNYSTGFESRGREYVYAKECVVYADQPLVLSQNPRDGGSLIDSDYMSFEKCAFVPTLQTAVAATGTVTAAAGALTFSVSQAAQAAMTAGCKITVASVGYGILTFNGTTGATCTGNPTFGATAFTITPASPNYPVTMNPNLRSVQHLLFRKVLFAQGKGGLSWSGAGATQDCVSLTLDQVRSEQTQNCLGQFLDISRDAFTIYGIRLISCSPSTAQHGVKLRRATLTRIDNLQWASTDPLLNVFDLDSTVSKTLWQGLWTQAGAGSSLTGQTMVWGLTRINSIDLTLPTTAYYDTSTNGAVAFGSNILYTSNAVRETLRFTSGAIDTYQNDTTTLVKRRYFTGREVHIAGITIGTEVAGTILSQITIYSPTLTPAAVAANTSAEQTFTVTGLTTADKITLNGPALTAGTGIVNVRVSAADTLAIMFANFTAGSLTPTSGTYKIEAVRS